MINTNTYRGIDLMKFIMAFGPVVIHVFGLTVGERGYSHILGLLIQTAVPYFFVCSGFLVAKRLAAIETPEAQQQYLRKKSVAFFKLLLAWTVVYLPLTIIADWQEHTPILECVKSFFLLLLTEGATKWGWTLWFIYSMAVVYGILAVTRTRCRACGVLVLIGAWIGLNIVSVVSIPFDFLCKTLLSRPLGGGIYILAGFACFKYFSYYGRHLFKVTLLFVILTLGAYFGVGKLVIWQVLAGVAAFTFAMWVEPYLNPDGIYLTLRKQSTWIYFVHMFFVFVLFEMYVIGLRPFNPYLASVVICAVTWIAAAVLARLQDRRGFGLLHYLSKA